MALQLGGDQLHWRLCLFLPHPPSRLLSGWASLGDIRYGLWWTFMSDSLLKDYCDVIGRNTVSSYTNLLLFVCVC